MLTHYTPNRKPIQWRTYILDFLNPFLFLLAVLDTWLGNKPASLWLGFGWSYILYRLIRRITKIADPIQLGLFSSSSFFAYMVLWGFFSGDVHLAAFAGTGMIILLLVAIVQGFDLRIHRLEAPTAPNRAMEFPGIYCITCRANGKQYIGQTARPIHERWKHHQYDLRAGRHSNPLLQADWNLYRPEQFVCSVLEVVTNPIWLFDRERYWQDLDYDPARRYNSPNAPVRSPVQTVKRRAPVRRKTERKAE